MNDDDLTLGFTGCGATDAAGPEPAGALDVASVFPSPFASRSGPAVARTSALSLRGLLRTIEGDIVPRLVMARCTQLPAGADAARSPTRDEVAELVTLLLSHDSGVALAYVAALHAQGMAVETVCLELLAPAARRIGVLWEQDRADIVQVTLALARLHTVLREIAIAGEAGVEQRVGGDRVLLVPSPGEHHTFGLLMVAEFFRRAGWDVCSEFPASTPELLEQVAADRYAVVGLSCACDAQLEGLASRIQALRRASRNRAVGVLVGGRVFLEHPEFAAKVGADGTASDGRLAAQQARRLRGLLAGAH